MSTLRVSTIQDTAGSNSSTPAAIANGIAKAWVNFNGTGVVAIRTQYNVSSITDNGAGDYTVNFTNAMSDANYSYVSIGGKKFEGYGIMLQSNVSAPSSTALRLISVSTSDINVDSSCVNVAIFR